MSQTVPVEIPTEKVQAYIRIPQLLFEDASDDLFIGIADNGNHFLERGITEGTKLVFDRKKPFQRGSLSCFIDKENNLHMLDRRKRGYRHLGRLIASIHTH